MPELEWRYGYVAVWGVILLVCVTLYVRFKRSGWL
jgi:magnesium transporter